MLRFLQDVIAQLRMTMFLIGIGMRHLILEIRKSQRDMNNIVSTLYLKNNGDQKITTSPT